MLFVLNTDQQTEKLFGGTWKVSTFFNGGTASLEVQQGGSSGWVDVGVLTSELQSIDLPIGGTVRLTKTGSAIVELSE